MVGALEDPLRSFLNSQSSGAINAGDGGTSPPIRVVNGINTEDDSVLEETKLVITLLIHHVLSE